jgi:RNA polymerase sigma-70 factor (ECF subfamily)
MIVSIPRLLTRPDDRAIRASQATGDLEKGNVILRFSDSRTSISLMDQLRQSPLNADAWDRFIRRYRPKIYGWCRTWGLQEADAEDVAQDVIAKLAQKMTSFQYDQSRCFRAWLKTITQRALSDFIANRSRVVGDQSITLLLENIEARADLERRIEEIFNHELLELAISRVRSRVAPSTWDAFRLVAFEGRSGAEAAQLLRIPVASVFVAKHGFQKLIMDEVALLDGPAES